MHTDEFPLLTNLCIGRQAKVTCEIPTLLCLPIVQIKMMKYSASPYTMTLSLRFSYETTINITIKYKSKDNTNQKIRFKRSLKFHNL